MKNTTLLLILVAFLMFNSKLFAQTVNHPFPNHTIYATGHIKPNNYTQSELDAHTKELLKNNLTFYNI